MGWRTKVIASMILLVFCTLDIHRLEALEILPARGRQVLEAGIPDSINIPRYPPMQQPFEMTAPFTAQDEAAKATSGDINHVLYTIELSIPVYSDMKEGKLARSPAQSPGAGQTSARDGDGVKILTNIIGCRRCQRKELAQGRMDQRLSQQRLFPQDQRVAKLKSPLYGSYGDQQKMLPSVSEYSFTSGRKNSLGFPHRGKPAYSGGKFVGFSAGQDFGDDALRDDNVHGRERYSGVDNPKSIYDPDTQYTVYLHNDTERPTSFTANSFPGIIQGSKFDSSQGRSPDEAQTRESHKGWAPESSSRDTSVTSKYLRGDFDPNLLEILTQGQRASRPYTDIVEEDGTNGSRSDETGLVQKRFKFFYDPFSEALARQKAREEEERQRRMAKARKVLKTLYEILKKKLARKKAMGLKW